MQSNIQADQITVGLAQMAPKLLDRKATLEKMLTFVEEAGKKGCQLVIFGEAVLPGYPFWIEVTDGARFNSKIQKEIYAYYYKQAVQLDFGHLNSLCEAAARNRIHIVTGIIERASDRGGHSLYCSLVYINEFGKIMNVHRKLMPTHEERLTWAPGDGYGLRTFPVGPFTMGALNCWENWMPLPRTALYGQGEDLHIALWPGNKRNTEDSTRFLAIEGRSYVISVSGLMHRQDFSQDIPHRSIIIENSLPVLANGGSCIAGPDGEWVIEPVVNEEKLIVATLDHARVREERQNFDPAGHYARPDILELKVNRKRQTIVEFTD